MQRTTETEKDSKFRALFDSAHLAGLSAARHARPRLTRVVKPLPHGAMIEYDPDWASDDAALGYCGAAWVRIRPATSTFARWCKSQTMAKFDFPELPCAESDPYSGGLVIHVTVQIPQAIDRSGQSYEIKMAYANAFAQMLQAAGYGAQANGRID